MSYSALIKLTAQLETLNRKVRSLTTGAAITPLMDALDALRPDLDLFRRPELTCVWHLRRATLLLHAGEAQAALEEACAGQAALGQMRRGDLLVDALVAQARALDALELWDRLDAICAAGIEIVETYRYQISGPYLKAGYMRDRIDLYALGVQAAFARGDLDTALKRAELSKCRLDRHRKQTEDDPVIAELRSLSARITELDAQSRDASELRARRRALWDRYAASVHAHPLPPIESLAEAQTLLAEGEAVLYHYWIDRTRLFRLVLSANRAAADVVVIDAPTRAALLAYIDRLSDPAYRRDRRVSDIAEFAGLLWPQEGDLAGILESAERLAICPHRLLHRLPFAALPHGDGFTISRWAQRAIPSLAALSVPMADVPTGRGVLTLGVEHYSGAHEHLKSLRGVSQEAAEVAALYAARKHPARTLPGDTSEAALLRAFDTDGPDVLHIACHAANVDAETPLEAYLYLATERVDGLDITLSGLQARTVVLSACSTGQRAIRGRKMSELPGDDLHGLQTAFFAAGARAVVANLFPVRNHAAKIIAPRFHAEHLAGAPADVALARAIRSYIAEHADFPSFASPDYWAPFFLTSLGPAAPSQPRMSQTGDP